MLLLEILVRAIKHVTTHLLNNSESIYLLQQDINLKLRERAKFLKSVVEEPHRRIIIDILNRLYSEKPTQTNDYWQHIYTLASRYFPESIEANEQRFLSSHLFGTSFHNPFARITQPARHLMIQSIQNALFQNPFKEDECLIFKLSDSASNRARIYSFVGGTIRQGAGLITPKCTVSIHMDDLIKILTSQSTFHICEKAKKLEIEGNRDFACKQDSLSYEHSLLITVSLFATDTKLNPLFNKATRPIFMFSEESFLYDGRFL